MATRWQARAPAILIAVLCATTALLVALLAAPRKRAYAIVLVSIPFAIGAAAAVRSALRARPSTGTAQNETIGTLIGDGEVFIARAPERAREFDAWMNARGLSASTADAILEVLWQNGDEIHEGDDELLLAALAAYGEAVRRERGGTWLLRSADGEPVIARGNRPWSRRRVLYEVLDVLSSSTPPSML